MNQKESNVKELNTQKVKVLSVRGLTAVALLSAMATILMLFEIPVWFAPSFYKIDFSELPVFVGAFALGPMGGVLIELVKILINFVMNGTDTAGIGELANFIFGCSLVVPGALIYQKGKNRKSAILGVSVGTIVFVIMGCLLNAYLLLPTYASIFGMDIKDLIAMGTKVNPNINNMMTFVLLAVAPFNLMKGIGVSALTSLLYPYVSKIIQTYHYK